MTKKAKRYSGDGWHGGFGYSFYAGLIILFFYLPILIVILFSFNAGKSATNFTGFSFRWYQSLFNTRDLMIASWNTFSIAFLATFISTVLGTLGSLGLAQIKKHNPFYARIILWINDLPVVNPDIVTAAGLYALFFALRSILPLGYMTMLLAHIAFCTPYVVIQVYPKVLQLDPAEMEAAMDLGARRRQAIMKVVVPDLLPSILSGALMAFSISFDDFIVSYFVGGSTDNIATIVYANSKKFDNTYYALMSLIFIIIAVAITLFEAIDLKKNNGENSLVG
jgi:spermidine/putrescine transport system permease protein